MSIRGRVWRPQGRACLAGDRSSEEASVAGAGGEGQRARSKAREVTWRVDSPEICCCFCIQSPTSRTIPPTTTHPSQCFISTMRGEFSWLRRSGAGQGRLPCPQKCLSHSRPAFIPPAPGRETAEASSPCSLTGNLLPNSFFSSSLPRAKAGHVTGK